MVRVTPATEDHQPALFVSEDLTEVDLGRGGLGAAELANHLHGRDAGALDCLDATVDGELGAQLRLELMGGHCD